MFTLGRYAYRRFNINPITYTLRSNLRAWERRQLYNTFDIALRGKRSDLRTLRRSFPQHGHRFWNECVFHSVDHQSNGVPPLHVSVKERSNKTHHLYVFRFRLRNEYFNNTHVSHSTRRNTFRELWLVRAAPGRPIVMLSAFAGSLQHLV